MFASLRNFLDFAKNEARNLRLHVLASAPVSPVEGQVFHNTTTNEPEFHNGTDFKQFRDAIKLEGQSSAFHRARANHTGTQNAATISDFDTQVRTNRLDQMAAPTAGVNLNSQKLTSVGAGTADSDGVNLLQVRDLVRQLDRKDSVRVAVDTNVNIANPGTSTFDGAVLANGESLLLNGQTAGAENGIYIFNGSAVALTRRADADTSAEVTAGMTTVVEEGTYAEKRAILATNNPIVLDTTALSFTFESTGETILGGAGLVKTGSTLDVGAGTGITVNANDVQVNTALVPRMFSTTVGDGAATQFTIAAATHGLGTGRKKTVYVIDTVTDEAVGVSVKVEADGDVVLNFGVAPTNNQYVVNILGVV